MSGQVEVKNLTKIFARQGSADDTLLALDNVSVDVQPGEFVTLLGASGCGKSTLLRILAGLEVPTKGGAYFNGEKISGTDPSRGLVFQEHTLFAWLTVKGNIEFALKAAGQYKEKKHEIADWLKLAGLSEFANNYPHQLSGGMRQRAALVRALAISPEVLLLDEPLGALDSFTRMNLQDELIRLWQEQGNTMIMVTHDVDEAIYLSRRIVIMSPRPGRISKILPVPGSYPRNRASGDFTALRTEILTLMDFAHESQEEYAI
ncbi:MAG: ABC transporter ATP-binding protein [Clostridiales Family XIII bacterium]|jgi:ABC-type nitrate/sulfonate/bicarbonate transport system ATPase subunit|nr:ABC transporter ATP-binding protein [Clostridiales Family XIII bacterium]